MDWWVIALLVGIPALLVFIYVRDDKRHKAIVAENVERQRIADEEGLARIAAFEEQLGDEWPIRDHRGHAHFREYIMMSADHRRVRFVGIKVQPIEEIRWDEIVEVGSIVSVELEQSSRTIMKFETATETKKSSPLLRAAVGGLAFGGAGAVVGAMSAGSSSQSTTTSRTETFKGAVYIVIGTTDMHMPVVKRPVLNRGVGEAWLHRIRGAVVLSQQAG